MQQHQRQFAHYSKPRSLFEAVSNYSLLYDDHNRRALQVLCKDNLSLIHRLASYGPPLTGHRGCVNTIHWSSDGCRLLSGGDDLHLKIWDPFRGPAATNTKVLLDYKTSHRSNIFSATFLPNKSRVVSCERDGEVLVTDFNAVSNSTVDQPSARHAYRCHESTCFQVLSIPSEPDCFFSCGEDGTVRFYDVRVKSSCNCQAGGSDAEEVLIKQKWPVTCMVMNPTQPYEIATGLVDKVRVYDRRKAGQRPVSKYKAPKGNTEGGGHRVTSIQYSEDGAELLASLNSHNMYLWSTDSGSLLQQYSGHRNSRTLMKECTFWGRKHVASGSDCGHIFFWAKDSGRLVYVLKGDSQIVNNVQPHPTLPILAVSGIDFKIKLSGPTARETAVSFEEGPMMELVAKNKLALEEEKEWRSHIRPQQSGQPRPPVLRMFSRLNPFKKQ